MPRQITIRNKQSLWDIAVQEAGTPEAVMEIAFLNMISPTAVLEPGGKLIVPDQFQNKDLSVIEHYIRNKQRPVVAWLFTGLQGIGVDGIGTEFEIG